MKKIGEFIKKYRFLIALLLLIVLVIGKFNGSSIGLWKNEVEPTF